MVDVSSVSCRLACKEDYLPHFILELHKSRLRCQPCLWRRVGILSNTHQRRTRPLFCFGSWRRALMIEMPSEGSGSGDVGAVKPRRPLFKKSAFGKAAPTEEGTGSDLFSRSKELFEEALREKERERQSKLGRTQKSRAGAAAAGKRRRLSGEVDDEEVDARSSSDEKATTAAQKSRFVSKTMCECKY